MTDYIPPLLMDWTDEGVLRPRYPKLADKYYCIGESYRMAPYEERSMRSHRYYFACLNESWKNLPEVLAERFPTVEHLRKYALIKAGFHDERSIVAASKAEAQRIAAFIRPSDDFAIVIVTESLVTVYTAKSQSVRAMGRADFSASKGRVLDIISQMIGVSADTLINASGKAA